MKENLFLEKLKKIVNHYEVYKQIAVNLEWADVQEKHMTLYSEYPLAFTADFYKFPKGYLKDNFEAAYVQSVLMNMGYCEEWEQDFWKIPHEERESYLTVAEDFYKGYMYYRNLSMKELTAEYMLDLIERKCCGSKSLQTENFKYVKDFVAKSEKNIELGKIYDLEHCFVSISEDTIMSVEFGIYD